MAIDGPKFKWRCSYQGKTWFDCWDDTGTYELELRRSAEDYERKCYNGDDADWQRNVVDMIGVLHRSHGIDQGVPTATFHAFNAWRQAEHDAIIAKMAAQPERYGDPKTFGQYAPKPAHAAARFTMNDCQCGQPWARHKFSNGNFICAEANCKDYGPRQGTWIITARIAEPVS